MTTTVDNHGNEELERGYAEGLDWAREFATAAELRNLVENANPDLNSARWIGFIAAAEEVLREETELPERPSV